MTQLVLEIKDNKDLDVILRVLEKFGVSVKPVKPSKVEKQETINIPQTNPLKELSWEEKVNDLFQFVKSHPIKVDKLNIPSRDERNAR